MESEARQLVVDALERFSSGEDKGAPFERTVLQALLKAREDDPAEFQRLKVMIETSGVPKRDFNDALKLHTAKEATPSHLGGAALSPERIEELERKGFVCDPVKGISDIHPNLFAKHVLRTFELRITKGERFFLYECGVWRLLPEKTLHRRLAKLIEREQPDVWRPTWESGYMATLARLAKHVSEFDVNKVHLNLTDGMFNTETFELEEHDPDFHSSIQNPIEYDLDAQCPRFLTFLNEIFQGDQQIIKVVQEMMGYCCTAETRAHKMFILEGIGSNGKSVLIEVIEHLCGKKNVSHVAMNELNQPFARAELVGKLLNVSSENEFSEKGLNTQQIKSITAGDAIRVENKHEKGFSYHPVCKLLFAMNALPATLDKSHGFFRRLVIVPFRKVFKGTEADRMLLEKLLVELPGIFNFAMEGLKRLQANDFEFSSSDAIEQAVANYKSEQNPVITFVSDYVEAGTPSNRLGKNELFERFQTWCRQQGETDFAFKSNRNRRVFWAAFRTALLEAGLPTPAEATSNGWRYYPGLTLLDERKKDMADLFNELNDETEGEEMEDLVVEEQHEDDVVALEVDFLVNGFLKGLTFGEWMEKEDDYFDQHSFRFQRLAVDGNPLFQERVTVA
ncbi:DNA primase family protein [Paenibacillus sp. strain BS8-2]